MEQGKIRNLRAHILDAEHLNEFLDSLHTIQQKVGFEGSVGETDLETFYYTVCGVLQITIDEDWTNYIG